MSRYIHIKTGNEYTVLGPCKVKINGEWKEGVEYVRDGVNEKFIREKEEFNLKFEPVKKLSERYYYYELKKRNLSVLHVRDILEKIGVIIPQRTLQENIDRNLEGCKYPVVKEVIETLIKNHDNTVEAFKKRVA